MRANSNVLPPGLAGKLGCFIGCEGGTYRKRPIGMYDSRASQQSYAGPGVEITETVAAKVIDDDKARGGRSHFPQQFASVLFRQVMQKQRAHDDVIFVEWIGKGISLKEARVRDANTTSGGLSVGDGGWIHIAAVSFDRDPDASRELSDAKRDVAAARGDIENPQGATAREGATRVTNRMPYDAGNAADRIRLAQAGQRTMMDLGIEARLVHQLRLPIANR